MKNIAVILILLCSVALKAQDVRIGQYTMYRPLVNVAEIGNYPDFSGALYYKTLYSGFDGSLKSFGASANYGITDLHTGGVTITNESIGNLTSVNKIMGNYSFRLKFSAYNANYVLFGLSAGIETMAIDNSKNVVDRRFIDTSDGLIDNLSGREYTSPQASFGAGYYKGSWYIGFSVKDLFYMAHQNSENKLNVMNVQEMNYCVYGGYNMRFTSDFNGEFASVMVADPGNTTQVDLISKVIYKNFLGLGLSYRTTNEMNVLFSFKLKESFTFGYSYEYMLGNSLLSQQGTHEAVLIYNIEDLVRVR
ncbi:MAG: PorP/SprF family type IX secretion system membrane protein [Ichthyobacteriaceae bacterium]|nr:PorP/SprF family type IX secretion system membrane protein [Ichthyobacteriaceae bacterium]